MLLFESEKGAEELGVDSDVEDESFVVDDDVYNLNISVIVTEVETPETADAFDDAMVEMEGKKSFHCDVCSKVCKSKGRADKTPQFKACWRFIGKRPRRKYHRYGP